MNERLNNEKKTNSRKILVFSGPTLSGLKQWRAGLEKFVFHAPILTGNLIEAYREGYRKVIIIDGYFESTSAVWHKEILYFMERGGLVAGCSSMGALRGAELERFGMLGFGKIFKQFHSGELSDDDEVTVAHLGSAQDFKPLTDSMVNIRSTLENARLNGIIVESSANRILELAKKTFYKQRNLRLFTDTLLKTDPALSKFSEYLKTQGVFDQKKADALELLNGFDEHIQTKSEELSKPRTVAHASYPLRILHLACLTEAPTLDSKILSPESILLKRARFLGVRYELLKRLAVTMSFVSTCKNKPQPQNLPDSWLLDTRLITDEDLEKLLSTALSLCPEYADKKLVPKTVRLLCLEFSINLEELESTSSCKRLLFLVGLFLDARLILDDLAKRVPMSVKKAVVRCRELHKRNHVTTDIEMKSYLKSFGLDHMLKSALEIERNCILLSAKKLRSNTHFIEGWGNEYWFEMAVFLSGTDADLKTLFEGKARGQFIHDFSASLEKMNELERVRFLMSSSLPSTLLDKSSIEIYLKE